MKKLILAFLLLFVALSTVEAFIPMAKADIIGDLATGKEKANEGAKAIIMIGVIVGIAGLGLLIPTATRRFGQGLLVGLLLVVVVVMIAKGTSVGTTLSDVSNASEVTDILSK